MKISTVCLAGLASASEKKVPPRHPIQRLNRLVEFTAEILNSGAFNNHSSKWIKRWGDKFKRNAERMETNFTRGNQRCGFYDDTLIHGGPSNDDRERRDADFDDLVRYAQWNHCIGLKQLITGFIKWTDRYISSCSGQSKHFYQRNRMEKWRNILTLGMRLLRRTIDSLDRRL